MIMEEGVSIEQLIRRAIEDGLTLEIDYAKNSYEKSSRVISNITLREEDRTFKISRIVDARIVPSSSKRTAKQMFNYDFDPSKPIFNLYGEEY